MRKVVVIMSILLMVTSLATAAWADNATQEECIAQCKKAAQLIEKNGIDAGIQAISDKNGPFVWKDTYVFLMDMDGKMLAHPVRPQLTQKGPLLNAADATGKHHFAEFVKLANDPGQGWVDYMWPKPGMEKPIPKSSYIYRVPGTQFFVGAGIYK